MGLSREIFRYRGIPVKIHFTYYVLIAYVVLAFPRMLLPALILLVLSFISVILHELGHSVVALQKNCEVIDIVMTPIGGLARLGRMPRDYRDEFQIAVGGPIVSLLLALTGWAGWMLFGMLPIPYLAFLFLGFAAINTILLLFNLIPAYPMDGGRVLKAWLTPGKGKLEATRLAAKTGRVIAIGFAAIGLFRFNWSLLLIAAFVYWAGEAEYRALLARQAYAMPEADIQVGPAPYAGHQASSLLSEVGDALGIILREIPQAFRKSV